MNIVKINFENGEALLNIFCCIIIILIKSLKNNTFVASKTYHVKIW